MNILGKHHHKDAKPLMTFTWGAVMLNDFNKKIFAPSVKCIYVKAVETGWKSRREVINLCWFQAWKNRKKSSFLHSKEVQEVVSCPFTDACPPTASEITQQRASINLTASWRRCFRSQGGLQIISSPAHLIWAVAPCTHVQLRLWTPADIFFT